MGLPDLDEREHFVDIERLHLVQLLRTRCRITTRLLQLERLPSTPFPLHRVGIADVELETGSQSVIHSCKHAHNSDQRMTGYKQVLSPRYFFSPFLPWVWWQPYRWRRSQVKDIIFDRPFQRLWLAQRAISLLVQSQPPFSSSMKRMATALVSRAKSAIRRAFLAS